MVNSAEIGASKVKLEHISKVLDRLRSDLVWSQSYTEEHREMATQQVDKLSAQFRKHMRVVYSDMRV